MSRARSFVLVPVLAILAISPAFSQEKQPLPDRSRRREVDDHGSPQEARPEYRSRQCECSPRPPEYQRGFIAQIKISGKVRHTGNPTSEQVLAYHGAGLLLWQDERTYIRLERASVVQEEAGAVHYANFEFRQNGKRVDVENTAIRISDQDAYLRLERRGDRVFGSVSNDGVRWMSFDPYVVNLLAELRLGVAAINASTEPYKAEFDEFEVFLKKEAR
jgi:regulation of enolase protein 1 (concanavalin A-like superfamily)